MSAVVVANQASAAEPVRIMALGDSITGSPGCWRALLWQRLVNSGHTVDFVGTLPSQGCGFSYDGENEGHGGALVTRVASQNQLPGWLSATRPDMVLMHFGTNDVWNGIAPATILSAYSTLVDQMRASNPRMRILVAKIIPMNPSSCSACAQRVIDLNNAIPGWASGRSTAQSPITVVDQWSGFSTAADTSDGVHPNNSGTQKMADRWYPAVVAQLAGVPTTAPTTPPAPGPSSGPGTTTGTLVGAQSGRCVDVPNVSRTNGTQVVLWDCTGNTNQQYAYTAAQELRVYGDKCLEARAASRTPGTAAAIADCTGGAHQRWTLRADGSIANADSGLCLDAVGQGTVNGTLLNLWTCNGQANQRWTRR
ncbi:MAG TPA: ricin-type beta-trefoil lectin domain protein [Micromonosporaceae bacterium]|nr:ricin-type beta-trefoil lectin domain protein [Micromonosporaceae bacterium]